MARISHNTILNAYDAVTKAVADQSKDARFSPSEVQQAAAKAKAEGRQDVASLIQTVHGELKNAEFKGGTVTKSDVAAGRQYLGALLNVADGIERSDGRNNGLSKAELSLLGPIVDAMVQAAALSAVLETSKPGRESKTYLTKAFDHAANILKAAAGNNRLTETEVKSALKGVDSNVSYLALSLFRTAKNTEQPGGHIGAADIDRAVAIHSKNVDKRDGGAPGLDNKELAALPPMYATAYNVGRAIEAGIIR